MADFDMLLLLVAFCCAMHSFIRCAWVLPLELAELPVVLVFALLALSDCGAAFARTGAPMTTIAVNAALANTRFIEESPRITADCSEFQATRPLSMRQSE